jgi:hypothetical protein
MYRLVMRGLKASVVKSDITEDKTRVITEGILDDIIVTLASWEYPVEFLVIHSKDPTKGHPVLLEDLG